VHQAQTLPQNINAAVLAALSVAEKDDTVYWANKLVKLPEPLQMRFAKRFAWHHTNKITRDGKSIKFTANSYLRKSLTRITPRMKHIVAKVNEQPHPWDILSNIKRTEVRAAMLALDMGKEIQEIATSLPSDLPMAEGMRLVYESIAKRCHENAIVPPFWGVDFANEEIQQASYEIALLKMQCEKWWKRKLKRYRLHVLEWLEIATGNVSKASKSPYASKNCRAEYKARQQSCADWIQLMELTGLCFNEDTNSFFENTIKLEDAVKSGMANPENRRNELMLRMRSMEEYADELGHIGMFYTLTAPSAYHANSDHWNGSSPKDTNNYFTKMWSKVRAKLNRLGLEYYGIRVSEPHADGTPHWHMALFMKPEHQQAVTAIMRKHAITEDVNELHARYANRESLFKSYKKARQVWGLLKSQGKKVKEPYKFYRTFSPRFTAVKIDRAHGSATSYIAKYISKNIDGFAVGDHVDEETGEPISQSINPVAAWASNWNVRQFQFQGSPSVTVYRELRKINTPLHDKEMTELRYAADRGDFKAFIKAMGGMNKGKDATLKTLYEKIPESTEYNEMAVKVKGVTSANVSGISRTVQWGLSKVCSEAENDSWTCGINCTDGASSHPPENTQLRKLGFTTDEIELLERGARVKTCAAFVYQVKDNQLREYRH